MTATGGWGGFPAIENFLQFQKQPSSRKKNSKHVAKMHSPRYGKGKKIQLHRKRKQEGKRKGCTEEGEMWHARFVWTRSVK